MIIKYTNEDFEYHWGFIELKDKAILDIGADFGSTAECFIAVGAHIVYAVEGNPELYKQLVEYSKGKTNIVPIEKCIRSGNDFVEIFNSLNSIRIDIVKIDCEGAEKYLVDVSDNVIRLFKEYIIESHHSEIERSIIKKFSNAGFNIIETRPLSVTGFTVIHMKIK